MRPQPEPTQDPSSLAGLRVLIVDDEPDARTLARRVLEERGAEVMDVGSAAEAPVDPAELVTVIATLAGAATQLAPYRIITEPRYS